MTKSSVPPHWNGLQISANPTHTRQDQIVSHFRNAIRRGLVTKGKRLPSTRQLALELCVSRQTVVAAYERLAMEELVESRKGDGTYVAIDVTPRQSPRANANAAPSRLSARAQQILQLPVTPHLRAKRGHLTPGIPALEKFPWATWRKAGELSNQRSGSADRLDRVAPLGAGTLREAISEYLAFSRGVLCEPEQIVVTAGAQNAIDLISRVLFDPGDTVWVEDPSYVAGRGTLIANGARVQPVPVDEEGLRVTDGLCLSPGARAAFVTPSHQYPLGAELSLARRRQLLNWAEEQGAWIVENDYGSDYRYEGRPIPTLYRLGRNRGDRVIFVGTFSNMLAPGLRLGFLVAPSSLVGPVERVRIFSDRQPPEPLQSQLAEFIRRGYLSDHLRKMNSVYQRRRDAILDVLHQRRSCGLDVFQAPTSGMHFVARLRRGHDAFVSRKALELGINVPALSAFFSDPSKGQRGLVIGFAGTAAAPARRATEGLCDLVERYISDATGVKFE